MLELVNLEKKLDMLRSLRRQGKLMRANFSATARGVWITTVLASRDLQSSAKVEQYDAVRRSDHCSSDARSALVVNYRLKNRPIFCAGLPKNLSCLE